MRKATLKQDHPSLIIRCFLQAIPYVVSPGGTYTFRVCVPDSACNSYHPSAEKPNTYTQRGVTPVPLHSSYSNIALRTDQNMMKVPHFALSSMTSFQAALFFISLLCLAHEISSRKSEDMIHSLFSFLLDNI